MYIRNRADERGNLSQKTGKTITITSNTYDRELTNTINSNYNNLAIIYSSR